MVLLNDLESQIPLIPLEQILLLELDLETRQFRQLYRLLGKRLQTSNLLQRNLFMLPLSDL